MTITKKAVQTEQEELNDLKDKVLSWAKYFEENIKRFNDHKSKVFIDCMDKTDETALQSMDKPTLRFNVIEAYVSRLAGEFASLDPQASIMSSSDDVSAEQIDSIKNIARGIFFNSQADMIKNKIYRNQLAGGFDAFKLMTDYENDDSWNQCIKIGKVYDPTLIGFDIYAQDSHKGDGDFCFEIIPLTVDKFKQEFPDVNIKDIKFNSPSNYGFAWNKIDNYGQKIIYVIDMYVKKVKKIRKYLLANKQTVTPSQYKKMALDMSLSPDPSDILPAIIQSDKREVTTIVRKRFIETKILKKEKTNFTILPIIFVDGNSETIQQKQTTRSYVYNVLDAQRVKNITMNNFCDEITSYRRSTIIAPLRSLPIDDPALMIPFTNPQKSYASYTYKDVDDKDGSQIAPPTILPRSAIPPELLQGYSLMDDSIQGMLGSYDSQLQLQNSGDLSGKAIINAATQSNSAAKPFMINYIASVNQLYKGIVSMIPLIYVHERNIPVMDGRGNKRMQAINDDSDDAVNTAYNPNLLNVYVEEGPSFQLQQQDALDTLNTVSQSNQNIASILATPQGTAVILDNINVNGIDTLKEINQKAVDAQEEQAEQQAKEPPQPTQPAPPDPAIVKLNLQSQQQQQQMQMQQQKMAADQTQQQWQNQMDQIKMSHDLTAQYLQLQAAHQRAAAEVISAQDEAAKSQAELRLKGVDTAFKHYSFMVNKFHELHTQGENNVKENFKNNQQNQGSQQTSGNESSGSGESGDKQKNGQEDIDQEDI